MYLAEHDVRAGEPLTAKLVSAIEECSAMIVLVTKNSLQSVTVQQEIGVAQHAGKMVIPILMGDVASEDLGMLNGIEYIRLDPVAPGDALFRLSHALGNLLDHQRQKRAKDLAVKRSRDEDLIVAGAVLVIIGLIIIISQNGP